MFSKQASARLGFPVYLAIASAVSARSQAPASLLRSLGRVAALAFLSALSAHAQMPEQGGHLAAPDSWLVNSGQPWHYKVGGASNVSRLGNREPTAEEKVVVEKAKALFARSSAKAMALVDGGSVVWSELKAPITPEAMVFGFSIGKTVTGLAIGRAICAGKTTLSSKLEDHVTELASTDLGRATVRDLLTMRSGTWEGNKDSSVWSLEQAQAIGAGRMNWLDLLKTDRVSAAASSTFGVKRKPGEVFSYKSTDPIALAVVLARATGTRYAEWVEQTILLPAGIEGPAAIAQDRTAGYGQGDGALRMRFDDWVRLAVWVRESENQSGCFGDYVRESMNSMTPTGKIGSMPDSYGYLTWVRGDSSWAIGHGGQRIAWNRRNGRTLVTFSSVEDYMRDLNQLYIEWSSLPSLNTPSSN